jgi:uncharacterized membrane protein
MGEDWPKLLGFNELMLKPDAHLIAKVADYPLLAAMQVAKGRSLIGLQISDRMVPGQFCRMGWICPFMAECGQVAFQQELKNFIAIKNLK